METIHLAIAEDNTLLTELLKQFLESNANIRFVVEAQGGFELLDRLEHSSIMPDIVLLDLKMKDGNGTDVLSKLKASYPELKIIVLTSYYKDALTGYMFREGVDAFLPKETTGSTLLHVIEEVYQKGTFFTAAQLDVMRHQMSGRVPKPALHPQDELSSRELEVLSLICHQYTAREIAEKLFLSQKTVEAHKSNLLLKTGARNTAGLIIYAIQNKLIQSDELMLFQ